jgi:hypothetical protein
VRRFKKVISKDGKEYMINSNGMAVPMPKSIKLGDPIKNERLTGEEFMPAHYERSFIKDTDENIAAIENILVKMSQLKNALSGLVNQEHVENRLASINQILMIGES